MGLLPPCGSGSPCPTLPRMKILFCLFVSFLTTLAKFLQPSGSKAILAENLLLKQQLPVLARSHQRAPNLPPLTECSWDSGHCSSPHGVWPKLRSASGHPPFYIFITASFAENIRCCSRLTDERSQGQLVHLKHSFVPLWNSNAAILISAVPELP